MLKSTKRLLSNCQARFTKFRLQLLSEMKTVYRIKQKKKYIDAEALYFYCLLVSVCIDIQLLFPLWGNITTSIILEN